MNHGSYVTYKRDRCRCDACREANRIEYHARAKRKRDGRSKFVDAAPVRERWLRLRALGMSDDEIERVAEISHHTSHHLFRNHPNTGKPITRIKRETAQAIMAINTRRPLQTSVMWDATETRHMVLDLMALGYTQTWVAERIGVTLANFRLLRIPSVGVEVGTHIAIKRLWESTTTQATETTRTERTAASRSRAYADRWRGSDGSWMRRPRKVAA